MRICRFFSFLFFPLFVLLISHVYIIKSNVKHLEQPRCSFPSLLFIFTLLLLLLPTPTSSYFPCTSRQYLCLDGPHSPTVFSSFSFTFQTMCLAGESLGCAGGSPPPSIALPVYSAPGNSLWGLEALSKDTGCCCVTDDPSGECRLGQLLTGSKLLQPCAKSVWVLPDGGRLVFTSLSREPQTNLTFLLLLLLKP